MSRTVTCAKLKEAIPGLPYKPFNDELGKRLYDSVSADAWKAFLFGDGSGVTQVPDFVLEKHEH